MKNTYIYIGVSIILALIGFITGPQFIKISIQQLDLNNVDIVWRTMRGQFLQNFIFSIAIGLLPFLHLISTKLSKADSMVKKYVSIGVILIIGIVCWQLRIFQLNTIFDSYNQFESSEDITNQYSAEDLKLGYYLIYGFIIGFLMNTIVLRMVNRRSTDY
ncbi:hypothetical protein [Labilibacter marinus]|uniref:hypothetical protein n=1 Tax=Labilibacter marinus TaxID=1477105 RepID=UPI00082F0155|nr:hypothetical protein [Labilibacter marinus]